MVWVQENYNIHIWIRDEEGSLPLGLIQSRTELFQFISSFIMPVGLFFARKMHVNKVKKFAVAFNVHRLSFTGVSFVIVGAKFLVQDGASSHQHEIQRPSSAWRYDAKLLLCNP